MDPYDNIVRLQDKARRYKTKDPEVALMLARKAAEAIAKYILIRLTKADPGTMMLDRLIERLASDGQLPRRILNPLRVIQTYGNYGAHDQSNEYDEIDSAYVTPCMKALETIFTWFQNDFCPDEKFVRTDINEIELSVRTSNYLNNANIKTFAELIQSRKRGAILRNADRDTIKELDTILRSHGLDFMQAQVQENKERLTTSSSVLGASRSPEGKT